MSEIQSCFKRCETYAFTLDGVTYSVDPPRQASYDEEPESAATVAALEAAGVQTLLTREGAVTIRSDGKRIDVSRDP